MIRDIKVGELSWEPHPFFEKLFIKKLLSHEKDNVDLSIMLVRAKKGIEVPAHVHDQDDIIYQLEGKNKIWVDGAGDFEMLPGSFIRIPAGVKHQPHAHEEDVLVFDIFTPHLF
jgi:quercetin dioxygenase-like cupin family protein